MGSQEGVPVPGKDGGFQKDAAGQIVLSRLDETLLTSMALTTGGSYVRSVAGDMDLDTIYSQQIRGKLETATVESGRKQVWADRFQWPLALAVMLLLAARWIPLAPKPLAALMLMALLCAGPPDASAGPLQEGFDAYQQGNYDQALKLFIDGQLQQPDRPEVLYNLGNAYYKTGDFESAHDHFAQALTNAPEELKPRLLYNMGNSAFRQGQLQEAIQSYEAALQLAPDDRQARDNLAFVKQQMQQQQQQQQQRSGNGGPPEEENPDDRQQHKNGSQSQGQKSDGDNSSQQNPSPQQDGNQRSANSPQIKPQEQPGASQTKPAEQPQKAAGDGTQAAQAGQAPSVSSQMLNRLQDQPGRALMPNYQKHPVDKDW